MRRCINSITSDPSRGRYICTDARSCRLCQPPLRLGTSWDEKKSICNKFAQSAAVTCLAWPAERHGDVCFGLMDGKVKLGMLKTNKTYTLYAHPQGSPPTTLSTSPDGRRLISGHADGSIYQFTFPEQQVRAHGRGIHAVS